MVNNIKSLLSKREQAEQEAINLAMAEGYKDPNQDESALNTLRSGEDRRFIIEFKSNVPSHKLINSNVKKVVVDKTRCVKELIPDIVKNGLNNPLIVEKSKIYPGHYTIQSGHNRHWCCGKMGFRIPVFVVSDNINMNGDAVNPLSPLRQAVLSNVKSHIGQYKMDDAIVHIANAMSVDPTFGGKNPSGKFPPRSSNDFDFNDLMDEIYQDSGWFLHDGTRTKIYKKYLKGVGGQKVTDLSDKDERTVVLSKLGWDLGLKDSGVRKGFESHIDTNRNAFILLTDSNGRHFEEKISQYSEKYFFDGSFKKSVDENNIKFVDIVGRMYKPSANKANLDNARDGFLQRIKNYNKYMQHIGSPFKIRYVVFPKQIIDNPQDKLAKHDLTK